jgi:hypothetical protein
MNMRARGLATALLPLALLACHRTAPDATPQSNGYAVHEWILPSPPGAAEPDLVATTDGRLLLSWIDASAGRRNALQFAQWSDGHWQSAPRTIAVGDALVANGADTPHLVATADGALWVQWLQRAPGGTGNDLMLSRSADGGFNWSPPLQINATSDGAEHGFASLWPAGRDRIGVAWLDGQATPSGGNPATSQHPAAATGDTALRAAIFDLNLQRTATATIDKRTCDCCRTGAATSAQGVLLAYRDRAPGEVRDIATARFDGSTWSTPTVVHADNWKMPACPVNGPALAADGNAALVAWYTAANGKPAVEVARSSDGGIHFDAPVTVEQDPQVQGRVAVAVGSRQAWVSWVSGAGSAQTLWLARYTPDLSRQLQRLRIATLQARGPGAGYPQLVAQDDAAYIVWSDGADGRMQLHGVVVTR